MSYLRSFQSSDLCWWFLGGIPWLKSGQFCQGKGYVHKAFTLHTVDRVEPCTVKFSIYTPYVCMYVCMYCTVQYRVQRFLARRAKMAGYWPTLVMTVCESTIISVPGYRIGSAHVLVLYWSHELAWDGNPSKFGSLKLPWRMQEPGRTQRAQLPYILGPVSDTRLTANFVPDETRTSFSVECPKNSLSSLE